MGLGNLSPEDGSNSSTGNAKQYVRPDREDFEDCLEEARGEWELAEDAATKEHVYDARDFSPHDDVVLRVFSTVDERTDEARNKGADAIRLAVWNKKVKGPMGGRKKTLRIKTWRKNLKNKIEDIFGESENYIKKCDECGSWMILREGEYGEFYGCSSYPDCNNTVDVED